MIRVLAIDDEPLALRQLVSYIQKVPFLQLVGQCQSAVDARRLLDEEPVDAIFCDINMPDLNGMDFVKLLAAPPLVVFTTAYAEYAVEGFRVNAVDYLLKPFGLQDFQRAANRLKERGEVREYPRPPIPPYPRTTVPPVPPYHRTPVPPTSLYVKTDYRTVKIDLQDIRYIEGMSEYLKIHLDSQPKPVITLLAMKMLMERLPQNFMRIHRSYIVNLDKIVEVNKNHVILTAPPSSDTPHLPIGDSYREAFNDYLDSRYLGK